jgi:putative sigma-54 modulation protein
MTVTVATRHMDNTVPLKTYAEDKAGKLDKFFDRITDVEVVIDHDGEHKTGQMRVEIIVNAEHNHRFVAHCVEDDAYAAVDMCVDKLGRQLSDHKKKIRNRKHPEA